MALVNEKSLLLPQDDNDEKSINKDEHSPVEVPHNLSTNEWQTFVNITKSIVGAGSFALPYCFRNMGIVLGILTVVIMGACSVYTTLMLLKSKKLVENKQNVYDLTYVDVARASYGEILAVIVYGLMLLASLGVAASYLVFIGNTMNEVYPPFSVLAWKSLALIVVIPVSFLRSFKYLSFTSLVGTVSLVVALCVTIGYGFTYEMEHFQTFSPVLFNVNDYFYSFGSVAFLFCIQFLVIPIERAMAKPDNFWRPVSVSVLTITIFNVLFALGGYQFWGCGTEDIILSNMAENVLTQVVKVAVCVDLLFTYPLVFAPGREIIENVLVKEGMSWIETRRNIIRVILVMVTFGFAQIENFGVITNLVGIPMSVLAFVLPPLMDIKLFGFDHLAWHQRIIYILLIIVGIFACIITTVYSFGFTPPAPCEIEPTIVPVL